MALKPLRSTLRINYGLERALRIWNGIDDEPMEFSARSIAKALEQIARTERPDDGGVLGALADALDNSEAEWKLTLTRRKRGKFVPPHEFHVRLKSDLGIWTSVELAKEKGIKVEAAVQEQAELRGMSRAAIFASLKRANEFHDQCDEISGVLGRDTGPSRARLWQQFTDALSQINPRKA